MLSQICKTVHKSMSEIITPLSLSGQPIRVPIVATIEAPL